MQDAVLKEIRVLETGLNIVNQHKQNSLTPTASFHTNAAGNPRPPITLQTVKRNTHVFTALGLRPHPAVR